MHKVQVSLFKEKYLILSYDGDQKATNAMKEI